ncbi:MAG: AIR carboxylase family protein [Acidimicrobiales bacterium]
MSDDPLVGVIMGSDSDWETMRGATEVLTDFGVPHEKRVVSAHRTPDLMADYATTAEARGLQCIIAGAGGAAHLPGMVAGHTIVPVIGVPIRSRACTASTRCCRSCRCPQSPGGHDGDRPRCAPSNGALRGGDARPPRSRAGRGARGRPGRTSSRRDGHRAGERLMIALAPGSTIGVVGGGQLGRMLAASAHRHGYRVAVLTGGDKDTPAGRVAEVEIAASFDDDTAVARFLAEADAITWEFENVEPGLAEAAAAAGIPVRPSGAIIAIAQDREREKEALVAAGVPVAPYRVARTVDELEQAVEELGLPVIAKAARFGYDGKGQVRIDASAAAADAWAALGGVRLVVETVIPFARELSVIVARDVDGRTVDHGVMQNHHEQHVLDTTVVPAAIPEDRRGGPAPSPTPSRRRGTWSGCCAWSCSTPATTSSSTRSPAAHNSGHCTIEAAPASQFDQQLRAVCGLPLGDGRCRPAAMVQLLGDLWADGEPDWTAALRDDRVHLHLYGKTEPRRGRKMGHLTCVGDHACGDVLQTALDARVALSGR